MLRLSLAGVTVSEIGLVVFALTGGLAAAGAWDDLDIGAGVGAGVGGGAGVGAGCRLVRRASGGSIVATPAGAIWRRDLNRNTAPSNAISPAANVIHMDHPDIQPRLSAAPGTDGKPSTSAMVGSDVGDGKLSSTGSAGVSSSGDVEAVSMDSDSSPDTLWPGVARAAGVNRRDTGVRLVAGSGCRMVGSGRGVAVGVGAGAGLAVGITRGLTGTGPSISTGP